MNFTYNRSTVDRVYPSESDESSVTRSVLSHSPFGSEESGENWRTEDSIFDGGTDWRDDAPREGSGLDGESEDSVIWI